MLNSTQKKQNRTIPCMEKEWKTCKTGKQQKRLIKIDIQTKQNI